MTGSSPCHPAIRTGLLIAGVLLVVVTPAVALLPGPGGIFTFAGGAALILRNSRSAKRRFVSMKRRWPRIGSLADRSLRRASARRRRDRDAVTLAS